MWKLQHNITIQHQMQVGKAMDEKKVQVEDV
jgi:hypothetical protein